MAVETTKIVKSSKLPPQNTDAEREVLGAILNNPVALNRIIDFLKPEHFYNPANRLIYDAMLNLNNNSRAIDILTVSEILRERGKLDTLGGRAFINDLALESVTSANIEFHAKIIQEKAVKRQLINAGNEIIELGFTEEDNSVAIESAEKLIFDIAQEKSGSDMSPLTDLLVDTIDRIEYRYNNKDVGIWGTPSGFYELDALTAGFQKSDLIILAARPSMGKTALALNIAQNVGIRNQIPVAIFSLEMSKDQLSQRILCSEAEIDQQKARTGNLSTLEWEKITNCMNPLHSAPIHIDDTGGLSVMEIRAKCRRLKLREPELGLVIIDYLQLINDDSKDNYQKISNISRGLKTLARELDVPVIALSQLSRKVEDRSDKRPMLSDLRESGAIEQDADIVLFIYRDEYYNRDDSPDKGFAEIAVAKQRNGPVGSFKLLFQNNITKFKNPVKSNF